jgi:fructose-1,6-bisphosphatase II
VNLQRVADAKGVPINDLTVVVLDRPRHDQLSKDIREAGARIKFITDGDVAGAVMAARDDTGVDLLMGIGGTPEGIIAACAMKCLGGEIQGRLWARNDEEHRALAERGLSATQVLTTSDLVKGNDCFFAATGITDGELLHGVRFDRRVVRSQSIVMRSRSKTIRIINSEHPYSSIPDIKSKN